MKVRIFLAQLVVVVACTAMALAVQQANDKNLFQQYVEKFGPPGPEHKMLEPLIGTWNARCRMWTDPSQAPQNSEGTLVRRSILGGRFVQEEFNGKLMDQPFEGIGTLGYDRAKRAYVCSWIDSLSTAIQTSQGEYDAGVFTFKHEGKCPITGKHAKMRDTLRIVSPTEQQMEMFRQLGDEKETKTMEIVLTRVK